MKKFLNFFWTPFGIFQKYFRIFRGFFPSSGDEIPRFHLRPQVAQIAKTQASFEER